MNRRALLPVGGGLLLLALAFVVVVNSASGTSVPEAAANAPSSSSSALPTPTSPAPTTDGSAPAATCWVVKLDPNKGNNVLSAGVTGTPSEVTSKLLVAAQQDPRVLQALWNVTPEGLKAPVTDWHSLVDSTGKCFSQAGQDLWNKVAVIYNRAPKSEAEAPAKGCNYYVVPGGNADCKVETITGDRSGTKYTFEDGTVVFVMHRCGNPVTVKHVVVVTSQVVVRTTPVVVATTATRTTSTPPPSTTRTTTTTTTTSYTPPPPPRTTCPCIEKTQVSQPVPSPAPNPAGASVSTRPSPNPTGPKPSTSSQAPAPTPSGYDSGGGSGSAPGGSQCDSSSCQGGGQPSPAGPAPTPTQVAPLPPIGGDPGL